MMSLNLFFLHCLAITQGPSVSDELVAYLEPLELKNTLAKSKEKRALTEYLVVTGKRIEYRIYKKTLDPILSGEFKSVLDRIAQSEFSNFAVGSTDDRLSVLAGSLLDVIGIKNPVANRFVDSSIAIVPEVLISKQSEGGKREALGTTFGVRALKSESSTGALQMFGKGEVTKYSTEMAFTPANVAGRSTSLDQIAEMSELLRDLEKEEKKQLQRLQDQLLKKWAGKHKFLSEFEPGKQLEWDQLSEESRTYFKGLNLDRNSFDKQMMKVSGLSLSLVISGPSDGISRNIFSISLGSIIPKSTRSPSLPPSP